MNLLVQHWPAIAENLDWFIVGTIPLASKLSSESLWFCIEQALARQVKVAVDINWRPIFWNSLSSTNDGPNNNEKRLIKSLLESASLLKLSREEAIWFFDQADPYLISQSLRNQPNVVITNGSSPIYWHFNGITGSTETKGSIPVVDTTGAGDAFTAGLIYQLIQEKNNNIKLHNAFSYAAACGALVCAGKGAIDPQPTNEQVEIFLTT